MLMDGVVGNMAESCNVQHHQDNTTQHYLQQAPEILASFFQVKPLVGYVSMYPVDLIVIPQYSFFYTESLVNSSEQHTWLWTKLLELLPA